MFGKYYVRGFNKTKLLKCDKKINQMFFISTLREPSVNRKDSWALTLVGPRKDNPEPDPLAVLHLDNWINVKS